MSASIIWILVSSSSAPMSAYADEVLRLEKDDLAPYDGVLLPKAEFFSCTRHASKQRCLHSKSEQLRWTGIKPVATTRFTKRCIAFLSGTVTGMALFYLLWAFGGTLRSVEIEILCEYAQSFLGVPYRFGGRNRLEGFDCSQFVTELMISQGLVPHGTDLSAQGLFDHFCR